MQPTDDTMTQIIRMVQAGWSVEFLVPEYYQSGGIKAGKPGEPTIWIEDEGWQDDIPAAWARLVAMWERVVGDA